MVVPTSDSFEERWKSPLIFRFRPPKPYLVLITLSCEPGDVPGRSTSTLLDLSGLYVVPFSGGELRVSGGGGAETACPVASTSGES